MPLKLAYLGVWHSHAVMHVREAAQRPDEFQIVGMYEREEAVRQQKWLQWTKHIPDIQVYANIEEVLFSEADAVIVEGRIHQNLDYAERALQAGKHVLLEKPAGVDLARLEQLQAMAEKRGLQLQVAYMWRYNPAIYEMIRLAKAGALGDLFYFRGHIPKPKSWHPQIEETLSEYQAGVYFEMAGHLVDIMVTLLGEPLRAQSVLGKHYGNRKYVDNAVVLYEFTTNCTATVETAGMHIGMDRTRRIELYGTEGRLLITNDASEAEVWHVREGSGYLGREGLKAELLELPDRGEPGAAGQQAVRDLVAHIEGGKVSRCGLDRARLVTELGFAFHESHLKGGARVALPLQERNVRVPSYEWGNEAPVAA